MPDISISHLNGRDVDALAMTEDEILAAVEAGLRAQGNGETNEIDAARRSINILLSDEELAARRKAWQAPDPRRLGGALEKYARLVGQANRGAVTHSGGVEWDWDG